MCRMLAEPANSSVSHDNIQKYLRRKKKSQMLVLTKVILGIYKEMTQKLEFSRVWLCASIYY